MSGECVAEGENGVGWGGRRGNGKDGKVDEEAKDAILQRLDDILRSCSSCQNILISAWSALLWDASSALLMGLPWARAMSTRFRSMAMRITTGL